MISGKSIIGVLAVTAIIASSCKKNPEASRLRSSKSCDIKEMGEKSDAASKAALGCAQIKSVIFSRALIFRQSLEKGLIEFCEWLDSAHRPAKHW